MNNHLLGVVAGAFTGMVLGALLVIAICSGFENYGGFQFAKEPLLLVCVLGIPGGGIIGGLIGRWSITGSPAHPPINDDEEYY